MAITFDEVSVDLREPETRSPAEASASAAPSTGPEVEERVEQWLRLRGERDQRLLAD
jgi:hypothetical protein